MAIGFNDGSNKPPTWQGSSSPKSAPASVNPPTSQKPKGVWFPRPTPLPIYEAKENTPAAYYTYYNASDLAGAYDSLDPNLQDLFTLVARSDGGRSGSALFTRLAKESSRLSGGEIRKSPVDLLYDKAMSKGILKEDGSFNREYSLGGPSSTGSRGYSGPVSTVDLMNERDLRSTADTIASTVIGRGVTEDEFNKILKQVRSAERTQPTVTTPGVSISVRQAGLSAAGRQDIIRDALMKGPEAEDYAKATTMMDIFNKALESRPEGA
jgi:hypothetical protein